MDLEFESSLGQTHFRTQGTLVLRGDLPLSYLMLNATFWKAGRLVESARYMMIGVDPGQKYSFEIFKAHHLRPEDGYTCVLVAEGPLGWIESETRVCRVLQAPPLDEGDFPGGSNLDGRVSGMGISNVFISNAGISNMGISDVDSSPTSLQETSVGSPEITPPSENREESPELIGSEDREDSGPSGSEDIEDKEPAPVEPAQNQVVEDRNREGSYVGSTESDKYHLPDCRYAQKIKSDYKIWFDSVEEAREQGYSACKVCSPP